MTLSEIKYNLDQFRAVPCKLYHEKVKFDVSMEGTVEKYLSEEKIYQRLQLCPVEVRNHRIGCAHTRANESFKNLLERIEPQDEGINKLTNEFDQLVFQIYMLDLHKGDLEKEFADTLLGVSSKDIALTQIREEISKTEEIHSSYIDEMNKVKKNVIHRMETLIDEKKHNAIPSLGY